MHPKIRQKALADYRRGTLYAIATAILIAVQEPFSAAAATKLSSLDFMAVTQIALLCSLPFLIARADRRRDFATILLDSRQWPKLAIIFLVGVVGLLLYDIGLSSAHPIITAAVLNLSPFWAALVAFVVSKRSISISPSVFWGCFAVAFCGAMTIAWSQIDVEGSVLARDLIFNVLHSNWIYALPMPVFFALSGTLVYKWFFDFDETAVVAANFVVSAIVLLPVAGISAVLGQQSHLSEPTAVAILMLLAGTLAAAAVGRIFYQIALTATGNDNGYVTMFFLLIPGISALISLPLSRWIPALAFVPGPALVVGMASVSAPLAFLSLSSWPRWRPERSFGIESLSDQVGIGRATD